MRSLFPKFSSVIVPSLAETFSRSIDLATLPNGATGIVDLSRMGESWQREQTVLKRIEADGRRFRIVPSGSVTARGYDLSVANISTADSEFVELGRRKFTDNFIPPNDGQVKVAFFDADSTLRVSLSGKVSANSAKDVYLLPLVAEKLKELADEGYLIAIVSNQNGIQYGHVTMQVADQALAFTGELIRAKGGVIHYYDFAEADGADRKPDTGMADRLKILLREKYGASLDIKKSIMVGDSSWKKGEVRPDGRPGSCFSNSDRLFASRLGVEFFEPADFFGWRKFGVDDFDTVEQVMAFEARNNI